MRTKVSTEDISAVLGLKLEMFCFHQAFPDGPPPNCNLSIMVTKPKQQKAKGQGGVIVRRTCKKTKSTDTTNDNVNPSNWSITNLRMAPVITTLLDQLL